jgi:hypothetical protein
VAFGDTFVNASRAFVLAVTICVACCLATAFDHALAVEVALIEDDGVGNVIVDDGEIVCVGTLLELLVLPPELMPTFGELEPCPFVDVQPAARRAVDTSARASGR